jgi:hypothetical protein
MCNKYIELDYHFPHEKVIDEMIQVRFIYSQK